MIGTISLVNTGCRLTFSVKPDKYFCFKGDENFSSCFFKLVLEVTGIRG